MSLNGRRKGPWVGGTGILVAAVMLATASFAGIAGAQSATPSPAGKSTFIYGVTAPNSSMNPLVGYLGIDYTIWSLEYNLPIEFATKDFGADLGGPPAAWSFEGQPCYTRATRGAPTAVFGEAGGRQRARRGTREPRPFVLR